MCLGRGSFERRGVVSNRISLILCSLSHLEYYSVEASLAKHQKGKFSGNINSIVSLCSLLTYVLSLLGSGADLYLTGEIENIKMLLMVAETDRFGPVALLLFLFHFDTNLIECGFELLFNVPQVLIGSLGIFIRRTFLFNFLARLYKVNGHFHHFLSEFPGGFLLVVGRFQNGANGNHRSWPGKSIGMRSS